MKKNNLNFLWICLLFANLMLGQKNIYIAVNGNDNSEGTIKAPLQSLEQAILKAKKSSSKEINIFFKAGTYYPEATVELNSEFLKDKKIKISAFKNDIVTMSAGRKFPVSWAIYKKNIYVTKLDISFETDALFINGKQAIMARYPNYDSTARVFNGTAEDAISDAKVAQWSHPEGGFFHALHTGEWGSFHYQITGKDKNGKLTMIGGWQNNRPSPLHPKFRFVENIFEELDAPGEWYYDKNEHLLYYYPRAQSELESGFVEFSHLKSILHLAGNETNPLKNISISKINFVHTKRVLMEQHEPLLRSDWMLHRSGSIFMEGTESCTIHNCTFQDLGATAIMVSGYNRTVNIYGNDINNIGESAICFVGNASAVRSGAFRYEEKVSYETVDKTPGPKNNLCPQNCIAYNNLIHDIGKVQKQATGVEISMSESITVKNNTIYNTPRAGINIGDGTWGGHIIEYNDVFNTVQETGDHGAFNSWGRDRYWNADRKYMDSITMIHPEIILLDAQKTTTIRNNRFRCDHGWDIDLDDGSSNYNIYNNICLNGGIKLREGFFRTVENNIMINNSFHPHVWFAKSDDVFRRNIVTRNYYPIIIPHWGKEVDFNFFPDSVSLDKAKKNGTDTNSLFGDPMFLDANKGDYTLRKNSPVRNIGFKDIDFTKIGVQDPKLKAKALKVAIPVLKLPQVSATKNDSQTEWLDVVFKNVNGLGDRSAYGLPSEDGVIVVELKDTEKIKTGLMLKDVILNVEDINVKNTNEFLDHYQRLNWTGKMNIEIMRNQQRMKLIILTK